MWALSIFPAVASVLTRTFYQLSVSGAPVPHTGPVLLVANHPNALLDPFLVVTAARRPVRFLAKWPLFTDPLIGWSVRAIGALPVYRRSEDPQLMERNEQTFRAVHGALAEGSAVAMFPEGISHDYPSLVPLKTGAARIALGAAPLIGGAFPIVPVGLVFESKQEFRSAAFAVIGEQVSWSDLAAAGVADQAAVRKLTDRITSALHDVTVNLERHEDSALIAAATAIYGAEVTPAATADVEAARRIIAAKALARLGLDGDPAAVEMTGRVRQHMRTLEVLGMSPADLKRRRSVGSAASWTLKRARPGAFLAALLAAAGTVLFWLPYRASGTMAERADNRDMIATRKLLYGLLFYVLWVVILAILLGVAFGWIGALVGVLLLPPLALKTLSYSETWTSAARDVRSFFVRRSRGRAIDELRERQRELGADLRNLYLRVTNDAAARDAAARDAAARAAERTTAAG